MKDNNNILFVHKQASDWESFFSRTPLPDTKDLATAIQRGRDGWIVTLYLLFKKRGYDVEMSDHFIPGRLCVVHRDDIGYRDIPFLFLSYVVAIRADRDRTFICDDEIVQSPSSIEGGHQYYIPYWPQPGLIHRDSGRGAEVTSMVYFGRRRNIAARFRSEAFLRRLREIGVELIIEDKRPNWTDYSKADVVLAVRDGSPNFLASKPISKLNNAWAAGCPALVGSEPVYEYHGVSEVDFFKVSNSDDVIDVLIRLKTTPGLFEKVAENGRKRAAELSYDATLEKWERLLFGVVQRNYRDWLQRPAPIRYSISFVKFIWRMLRRTIRGKQYVRGYDENGLETSYWRKLVTRVSHGAFD